MAQVKETMNMILNGNMEAVTGKITKVLKVFKFGLVELYRQELNPYVVILSKMKKVRSFYRF